MLSEARTYGASPSRTLQRRIHLMNTIPNVHEYLIEHRPCTTESVHQTSAASSDGEVANMKELYDEENMDSNRYSLFMDTTGADPEFLERGFIYIKVWGYVLLTLSHFYTPPLKCGEVLCYTLRCLSVCPSVRPSVCAHHFRSIT